MKRKIFLLVLAFVLSPFATSPVVAAIDLQADLNRINAGINQFDANSAASSSASTMAEVKRIFSNNTEILREIKDANASFKRDLNSAKRQIPSRDSKESPAFNTLMNLTKGYEEWLKYQNINQLSAQRCINNAGSSISSFSSCLIGILPRTLENERIGRQKLQAATDAWKRWRVKYGYA